MQPTKPKGRFSRTQRRRALFVATATFVVVGLTAVGREHASAQVPAGLLRATASSARSLADVSVDASVLASAVVVDSHTVAPPVFAAIDFVEESGSIYSIPSDRICALSINAPRTVCVIEGPFYQAVIEGANLEPLYRQIQKRQVGKLKADALADGDTYSVPVVPMATLMELSKAKASGAATPELVPQVDSILQAPVIGRVRVVPNVPFHFDGRTGAYVSDEGGK